MLCPRAFTNLDVDQDGLLGVDEIIAALRTKLPPGEIRAAVELAMQEAGHGPASAGLAFEDFMRMLKVRAASRCRGLCSGGATPPTQGPTAISGGPPCDSSRETSRLGVNLSDDPPTIVTHRGGTFLPCAYHGLSL